MTELPSSVRDAVARLFDRLPLNEAMPDLVPSAPRQGLSDIPTTLDPTLQAAIWLYVDVLDRSHTVSQHIDTEEGSFWHGIMHRREGDFSNSIYWFRRAGSLPTRLGLDPVALTEEVARHYRDNPPHLVEAQRREWIELFEHCARQAE